MREIKITYNNNLGKVTVLEKNGNLYIKRSAYNRVWKKCSKYCGGGLAKISFDNGLKVNQVSDIDYVSIKLA